MKASRWIWGIFFICAALIIVLSQGNYSWFYAGEKIGFFELVVSVMMVPVIIESFVKKNFIGIFFPLALIGYLFSDLMGLHDISLWLMLVAALFLTIGFSLIFQRRYIPDDKIINCTNTNNGNPHAFRHEGETTEYSSESIVNVNVAFGTTVRYIHSTNLERINLSCSFGHAKVFFDNARIGPGGAVMHLDVSFGGVQLYIPRTWRVDNSVSSSLGGVQEKNSKSDVTDATLFLNGNVNLSGVEIYYV